MATNRISVRLNKEKIKFLEQVGHDPTREKGARTRGVEAVIAFAQMTPRAFQAFLNGRGFADIGEIITVREGDYLCPACGEKVETDKSAYDDGGKLYPVTRSANAT